MCAERSGEQEQLLVPSMPSMRALAGDLPLDVHIVGFGKTVNVFSSKQRPKELIIYGSDFKYVFALLSFQAEQQSVIVSMGSLLGTVLPVFHSLNAITYVPGTVCLSFDINSR